MYQTDFSRDWPQQDAWTCSHPRDGRNTPHCQTDGTTQHGRDSFERHGRTDARDDRKSSPGRYAWPDHNCWVWDQPLPMQSTIIVAKSTMEYPPVQVGKASGIKIGPDDTPAVPRLPPQPPPPQATRMMRPQVTWAPNLHVRTTQKVENYIPMDMAWAHPWDMTNNCIQSGSAANPGILIRPASPSTPFEFPFNITT